MDSAMILYIPYTFGPNFGKPGVTKEQIFWHMRNLNMGTIDHIDGPQEKVDKKGINVRSWYVHFSTWTATQDVTDALNRSSHIEIDYDNYGHFWKVFKYVPKCPPAPTSDTVPGSFRLIAPKVTETIQLAPIPKKRNNSWNEFVEFQKKYEEDVPYVDGLTDSDYKIFNNMYNEFEDNVLQNERGLKNESVDPADTVYYDYNMHPQQMDYNMHPQQMYMMPHHQMYYPHSQHVVMPNPQPMSYAVAATING